MLIMFQISRLLSLRQFCEQNAVAHNLLIEEWEYLESLKEILTVFYKISIKLQKEHCTLSDFFGYWTFAKKTTEKNTDPLSQEIVNQMNHYNAQLMDNPALLGSAYMDPRYQRMLNNDQKATAIAYLTNLYIRMKNIEQPDDVANNSAAHTYNDNNSFEAEMDGFLSDFDIDDEHIDIDIEDQLRNLKFFSKDSSLSPMAYWQSKQMEDRELYQLAITVHSIPPTQTTVERAFSALSIILNCRRTKLNDESLQSILLLRLNPDLYKECIEFE